MNKEKITHLTAELLRSLGEDVNREGLAETPERVANSWEFLTSGYQHNPEELLSDAVFTEEYDEIVLVKNISYYSLCEHHLLPFYGRCHVGYIPDGKIVGLSKIARIVEVFSRRLQVQERMTSEIASVIDRVLHPRGVAVVVEANHLCMAMRGVEQTSCSVTTSAMHGVFRSKPASRNEFLKLLQSAKPD